jgi:Sulfotransferase family
LFYRTHRLTRVDLPRLNKALAILEAISPSEYDVDIEEPIFIFSAGWRSGSTLIQRILCTDPSLFLWGEPLGRMSLLPRLTSALCTMTTKWPPYDYWCPETIDENFLETTWIANLFPNVSDFRSALRAFLLRWLADPARNKGRYRWGFKEVRLGLAEARVLTWLFPRAKFLVVVRHPYDAYRSVSRAFPPGKSWKMYSRWPDIPLTGAASFAAHWNCLTTSWLVSQSQVNHRWIRYEDLIAGQVDFRSLEDFLGLNLEEQRALEFRLGGTENKSGLHEYEKRLIALESRRGMHALGYRSDGKTKEFVPSLQLFTV